MLKITKKNNKLIFLLLLLVLIIPSLLGLIHQGFPLTDDGNWMVIRFSAFYEVLRSGEFPVRFLTRLNNGYGYPVADFLYPLFMYMSVPIHILGFNFVDSIKVILGLSLVFSCIFTYFWLKERFNNLSSMVGALFYTLFPYHLYDIYKRGSVGEVLSLSIVPFILWQIEKENLFFSSIGIAFLIVSHNTLAFLFLPLIFFYGLLKDIKLFKFSLVSTLFGLIISAFFWVPALYDTRYIVFNQTQVSDFYNYFIGFKNYDILGIVFFVTLIIGIFVTFIKKDRLFIWSLIFSLIISFFVFPISKFFWPFLPITNLIQFPFRLISLIIVLLAFQVAFIINLIKNKNKFVLSFVFVALIYISAKPYLFPKDFQYFPDTFYSTNQDTTTVKNEYMPRWVKKIPLDMASSKVENLTGAEKINITDVTPKRIMFQAFLSAPRKLRVSIIYFPGWVAYINGVSTPIDYNNKEGLITLNLNKGNNNVLVLFKETSLRLLSDMVSVFGLTALFLYIYLYKKKAFKFLKL